MRLNPFLNVLDMKQNDLNSLLTSLEHNRDVNVIAQYFVSRTTRMLKQHIWTLTYSQGYK